jgi:uncharacterized protein
VAQARKDQAKWREIVRLLLDAGADYDIQSAIHLADLQRVHAILRQDPTLANGLHGAQKVPLRVAALEGRIEICELLLRFGADPDDFRDGNGIPIICNAVDHPKIVKLLVDAGADLKKPITWRGGGTGAWVIGAKATALHYAAERGQVDSARLLLDHGVPVDGKDDNGQTPLYIAAVCGRTAVIRLLLQRGADPQAEARNGRIPINVACESAEPEADKTEAVRLLKEAIERGKDKGEDKRKSEKKLDP